MMLVMFGRLPLVVTVVVLPATNVLGRGAGPAWHAVIGVGLVIVLALIAFWAGLSADELGLARRTAARGLRWGATSAAVVAAVAALAYAVPPARDALAGTSHMSPARALVTVVVFIPLGTVLPEEFAFRGVLWALLRRHYGEGAATAVSSALFGLWHVLAALTSSAANQAASSTLGSGEGGTVLRVIGTVLFTGLAGAVLCMLRIRSGSLLAPIMAHWAVNGIGTLLVLAA
jgi:membrane protease YdiL (CAAX protease family)